MEVSKVASGQKKKTACLYRTRKHPTKIVKV